MSQKVTVFVRTVGQSFGCMSTIRVGSKPIWESRVFPYGFTVEARLEAESKAKGEGWTVVTPKKLR